MRHLIQSLESGRVSRIADMEHLARLFESRYDLVMAMARCYTPDTHLTYDVIQESFIVFVRGVAEKDWDVQHDVDSLLRGIVKRVALKYRERESKHAPEALQRIHDRILRLVETTGEFDELQAERVTALRTCVEKLPFRSRLFLEQHYREHVSLEELGDRNGIKPNTIRQMFCRLRKKLRDCIERVFQQQEES